MNKHFIPYEEALALKELGFDEPCFGYYYAYLKNADIELKVEENNRTNLSFIRAGAKSCCLATLWQQTFDWLREQYKAVAYIQQLFYNKGKDIAYIYNIEGDKYNLMLYNSDELFSDVLDASTQDIPGNHLNEELFRENIFKMNFAYHTYEEARLECLRHLIKIVKDEKE